MGRYGADLTFLRPFYTCRYAQLSANIAAGAEMGVLAIDYRTTTWRQQDSGWPYPMEDTLAAAQWLRDNGASKIFLTGDSTGASQAIQTMIYNIEERKNVTIDGAVTFSAWTDFTCSSATYQYRRACDGWCTDIGEAVYKGNPAPIAYGGRSSANGYTAPKSIDDPRVNPWNANPFTLAKLPPLLLIVGSGEVLLGENLQFGQMVRAAGAIAQVEVWGGMWHDFQMATQGCGAGIMYEAVDALQRAGQFFRGEGRCTQDCTANCPRSSPVPVQFHYLHQQFPSWDGNGCNLPKEDWSAEFQDPAPPQAPPVPQFMELRL